MSSCTSAARGTRRVEQHKTVERLAAHVHCSTMPRSGFGFGLSMQRVERVADVFRGMRLSDEQPHSLIN